MMRCFTRDFGEGVSRTQRGRVCILIFWLLTSLLTPSFAKPQQVSSDAWEGASLEEVPPIQAESALLMEAHTGAILYAKNPQLPLPIASLTKVMTAILILESRRLKEIVTAPPGIDQIPASSLFLKPGEKISLEDLLWAILLRSANDACVASAVHLEGSVENFVAKMNRRAKGLGCQKTHFVTPNGLHDPNHYSTAEDLARIVRYAISFPEFNRIVATKVFSLSRPMSPEDRVVVNRNRLLWRMEGADGIKTGYTRQAGHCLIASATRKGRRLIAILLHSPRVWEEVEELLNWGFQRFRFSLAYRPGDLFATVLVGSQKVPIVIGKPLWVLWDARSGEKAQVSLHLSALHPPVFPGERVGYALVEWRGQVLERAPLFVSHSLPSPSTSPRGQSWAILVPGFCLGMIFYAFRKIAKNHCKSRNRFSTGGRRVDSPGTRYR